MRKVHVTVALLQKTLKRTIFSLTALIGAAAMTSNASAGIEDWQVRHYYSNGNPVEEYYLAADANGAATYEDGSSVPAYMRMYVDQGKVTFSLTSSLENNTYVTNQGESTITKEIQYTTYTQGDGEAMIYLDAGSDEYYFSDLTSIDGTSMNDVILKDMLAYGCETFTIPMNRWGEKDMPARLEFYLPQFTTYLSELYAQAEKDGWKQPIETGSQTQTELQGTADEADKINVDLIVNYKANELFSIYDADMYLDGELIKTFSQGTSSRVTLRVTRGEEHTVSFYKHGDKSLHDGNRHIFTFTLGRDGEIECSIAAHWYGMLVKETRLK